MKHPIHFIPSALSIAMACALSTSVMAITPSIYTGTSTVVNPFTGLATDAWKFAGYAENLSGGKCSAVQITPQWVVATAHCPLNDSATFHNGWSTDPAGSTFDCDETTDGGHKNFTLDLSVCRLKNPERFSPPATFPPMIGQAAALLIQKRGLGSILYTGYAGGAQPTMNFGQATTERAQGASSFDVDGPSSFHGDGGDSGGGMHWFGANDGRAALYWIISGAHDTTVDWRPWVMNKITSGGGTPPAVLSEQDVLLRANSVVPPPLSTGPVVRVTGTGQFTVTWMPPSLSSIEQIDDYHFYEGVVGSTPRTMFTTGTTAVVTGAQQSPTHRVCAVPRNDGLESITLSNCTTFESAYPLVSGLQVASSGTTSLKTVRTSWNQSTVNSVFQYTAKYTVKSQSGSVRTASVVLPRSSSSPSFTVGVTAGSEFCVQVYSSTPWSDGAITSTCKVIN